MLRAIAQITNCSSYAALNQKRNISGSRAVIWYADHLYTPYNFEFCGRKRREQNQNFHIQFSLVFKGFIQLGIHFTIELLRVQPIRVLHYSALVILRYRIPIKPVQSLLKNYCRTFLFLSFSCQYFSVLLTTDIAYLCEIVLKVIQVSKKTVNNFLW